MSSKPFKLSKVFDIPIVDNIPAENGIFIVRSTSKEAFEKKLSDLLDRLTKNDVVKILAIGFRPDHPVTNAKWFTEVWIGIDKAEEHKSLVHYHCGRQIVVGNRKKE